MTEAQENKAHWLYRWGSAAGMSVSRDEVRDMLRHDRLNPQLQGIWEEKRAQQKLVISICDAVVSGNAAALQVHIVVSSCLATWVIVQHTRLLPSAADTPDWEDRSCGL